MTIEWITELAQEVVKVIFKLASFPLAASLVMGLAIGIFQAVTQINEMTLTFVPKIILVLLVLAFAAPWMLEVMVDFTTTLYAQIPLILR